MSLLSLLLIPVIALALNVSAINRQAYEAIEYMKKIEEFPDYVQGELLKLWLTEDSLPSGRLFYGDEELKKEHMKSLHENMNLSEVPPKVEVSFGWTKKPTDMKLYPTRVVIHNGNKDIDYNQYTVLDAFTPVVLLHRSKDKRWCYVHAPYMRGWVECVSLHMASREELKHILSLPFLVVIKGSLKIGGVWFYLGSRVPYLEKEKNRYLVLLPDGSRRWVSLDEGFHEGFLKFSPDRAKHILDSLLGSPYRWGGKWDCSALVKDLYAVFGLELPRNSSQQAQVGRVVATSFKSYEELKETLRGLPPFQTLIFFKGHVMIYGGMEGNEPVVYHAVYKLKSETGSEWWIKAVKKNLLESHRLRNIHRAIVSVNVLD